MLCGIADCRDSGIEDCGDPCYLRSQAQVKTVGRAQGNVQRMGRAQAKAVGATGADRLRTYGSDKPA